jgi:hypothetical protein
VLFEAVELSRTQRRPCVGLLVPLHFPQRRLGIQGLSIWV